MEEIFISLERMQELAREPGLAMVLRNGRWLYSWNPFNHNELQCSREKA